MWKEKSTAHGTEIEQRDLPPVNSSGTNFRYLLLDSDEDSKDLQDMAFPFLGSPYLAQINPFPINYYCKIVFLISLSFQVINKFELYQYAGYQRISLY